VDKVTLLRLEPCGAVLLVELIDKILPVVNVENNCVHLWTDSTIVWSWISSPATRWITFVANGVAHIQETTNVSNRKRAHVGESCRYHSVRNNTEEVGESAAVLVGKTVASTVSLFKAFCKGSGND
jgi:hypothetical protein